MLLEDTAALVLSSKTVIVSPHILVDSSWLRALTHLVDLTSVLQLLCLQVGRVVVARGKEYAAVL